MTTTTINIYEFIASECKKYIDSCLMISEIKNPMAIFDIDGTVVDHKGVACIQPIISLYNYCVIKGVLPVFISARIENPFIREMTYTQLIKCGIKSDIFLYLMNSNIYNYDNVGKYKLEKRKEMETYGYTIIMSIGDMPHDIGLYTRIGVLLPGDHFEKVGFYRE